MKRFEDEVRELRGAEIHSGHLSFETVGMGTSGGEGSDILPHQLREPVEPVALRQFTTRQRDQGAGTSTLPFCRHPLLRHGHHHGRDTHGSATTPRRSPPGHLGAPLFWASWSKPRRCLRRCQNKHTIPEPKDRRANRKRRGSNGSRPTGFDKEQYERRNEVERTINRIKNFRAVATRYENRAYVFRGTVTVAAIRLRLRLRLRLRT